MNHRLLICLVFLVACKEPVPPAVALAGCIPAQAPTDTLALASCLVDQHDWPRDSAAHSARQVHDSILLLRQRQHDDSVAAAGAEATLTQVNDAADAAKQHGAVPQENYALAMIWVGSKKSKLYYRGHCAAAKAVRGADREEFSNNRMAEQAGYQRSTVPADSACYIAPGL